MRRFVATLLGVFMLGGLLAAQAEHAPAPESDWPKFDRACTYAFQRDQTYGAAVALAKQGEIVHTFAYGTAVRRTRTPVADETLFRLASVTKMVSAIGVMRLVEQGVLDLDADIGTYLGYPVRNPRFPEAIITLRQLLAHTAGLRHNADYAEKDTKQRKTLQEMLVDGPNVRRNYADFAPGTQYEYTNFGAGLIGSIMEAATGESVDALMNRLVFAPLGVTAGYAPATLPAATPFAIAYRVEDFGRAYDPYVIAAKPWNAAAEPEQHYDLTAGMLHISAPGLAKVVSVLACGGEVGGVRLLQPETVALMLTAQTGLGSCSGETPRGLGIDIRPKWLKDRFVYGHQGTLYNILCDAFFDPADGTVVVLLTNATRKEMQEMKDDDRPVLATQIMTRGFAALAP